MSLFVSTNVSSLNAQRELFTTNNQLDTALERLSSGFRVNSSKDDATGMQISNRITSQLLGLQQAARNANDGISLAQVAEGSMREISGALQRIRTLAVQAQSGINVDNDRQALQKEVSALKTEISRIAATSQFAGTNILSGSFSAAFLIGAQDGQFISLNLSRTGGYGINGLTGGSDISVETAAQASAAIGLIDAALSTVNASRSELGAIQSRFEATIRNLSSVNENAAAARMRIRDTDYADETAMLAKVQILQQASTTILSQSNQRPQQALQLLG